MTELEPGLRLVRAANPSPMTEAGTNTYLLGTRDIAVIDPGPQVPGHLQAILNAVPPGGRISHIFVTHAHLDHSSLAGPLARATGAPVHAFGDALAGRSPRMATLAQDGDPGGGEGVDAAFRPDICLPDGAVVTGNGWQITAIHTPGHFGNHLCFCWQDVLFTGDHVMGWASSLISPPDGCVAAYRRSLARLVGRADRIYHPGHGAPVTQPASRLDWLIRHRQSREDAIRSALTPDFQPLAALIPRAYPDTPPALHPAAARNLFAHLIDLTDRNLAEPDAPLSPHARFCST